MRISIAQLLGQPGRIGRQAEISGRVRTVRDSKNIAFVEVWDGSCLSGIQVVAEGACQAAASALNTGAIIRVSGELVASPNANQPVEIKAAELELLFDCPGDYPLQKKRHSFEYLRTVAHLRPRTNTFYAVFKIRSLISQAIHAFFAEKGFVYVHTPIITGSDAEGAGEMFQVTTLPLENVPKKDDGRVDYNEDFFGKMTHLTVSGQLNVEGFALAMGNVYTFGPTFRSENSNTARHASEFWMVEPEMCYCDLKGNMQNAGEMIKYCIRYVLDRAPQEMTFFDRFIEKGVIERLEKLYGSSFEHMTYTEAVDVLQKSGQSFEYPVYWGCDLQSEHERYLAETVCDGPVFVTDYPKEMKAFYMRQNEDGKTVAAMDMLVPGVGELIGGSQREERYDRLLARIRELDFDIADYQWYLDLRRFGSIVHSGYGLGLDRAVMYFTGMANIRDVQPYPRTPRTADF